MNRSGKVVLCLDSAIIDIEAQVNDGLLPIGIAHTSQIDYGYLNLDTGDVKIEPQWHKIENYEDGFAIVCCEKNERYGVVDTNGDYIIEPKYSFISRIEEVNGIYFEAEIASEDGQHHYIFNSFGEEVQYVYYTIPSNG